AAATGAPRARQQARGVRPFVSSRGGDSPPGRGESETAGRRDWRAHGAPHVGAAVAAPSTRPLRRADGGLSAGRHAVDPPAPTFLLADSGPPQAVSWQARRR